jgi:hypothetical protein
MFDDLEPNLSFATGQRPRAADAGTGDSGEMSQVRVAATRPVYEWRDAGGRSFQ